MDDDDVPGGISDPAEELKGCAITGESETFFVV